MKTENHGVKVAVIGAGPICLAAVKNLREEGYEAVAFERTEGIGGVWRFNPNPRYTSTLPSTLSNVSKFKSRYADFSPRDDFPPFLSAPQVLEYLNDYASYFKLHDHIVLNAVVQRVHRNEDDTTWLVHVAQSGEKERIHEFDKVIFCNGVYGKGFLPEFAGTSLFKGKVIHSQAFKRAEDFKDMNVVIVGLGNTAADASTALIGHAKKIHVAHRRGIQIFPRQIKSKPIDLHLDHRSDTIKQVLASIAPNLAWSLQSAFVKSLTISSFGALDPSWNIHPPPSIRTHQPTISDTFIPALRSGEILSVAGLDSFTGASSLKLLDGTELTDIDAVIFCTGYQADFSILDEDLDPDVMGFTSKTQSDSKDSDIFSGPISSMYMNMFHPRYPSSLAFFNNWAFTAAAIPVGDLMSMATAQLWSPSGAAALSFPPSQDKIDATIAAHRAWVLELSMKGGVYGNIVDEGQWLQYLHHAAGTRLDDLLGLGLSGWWYWLRHPKLANMLWGGVDSPASWRLFDPPAGYGRKKWDGAEEAIRLANEEAPKWFAKKVNEKVK